MAHQLVAFVFAPGQDGTAARVARIIGRDLPGAICCICTDSAKVTAELRRRYRCRCMAVLLAARRRELDQLVELAAWFDDVPLILMVPDYHAETIAKAHRLRPRYLISSQVNYRELQTVVRRIVARYTTPRIPRTLIALPGNTPHFLLSSRGIRRSRCRKGKNEVFGRRRP